MLKKLLLAVFIFANAFSLFAQTACNIQVKTYAATCKGGADGKAEIWKDGQLVVIDPGGQPLTCTPPETPTMICTNIPSSAVQYSQSTGDVVINNQTVYLTANNFNGNIRFDAGGTLVICKNATIQNLNINTTSQQVNININGSATLMTPNFNFSPNVTVTNYGTINVKGAGFNGKLYNHGTLTSDEDFSVNSIAGLLYNTGTLTFKKSFNIDQSSVFTNNGTVNITTDLKNNGGASIVNNCTINVGNNFHQDAPTLNSGNIFVTNTVFLNTNTYKGNSGSLLRMKDLMMNTVAEGIGNTCASLKVTGSTTINGSGKLQGRIDLCRGTGTFTNGGAILSPATANCSCTPTSGGGTGGITGTVTWSSGTPILYGSTVTNLPAGPYTVTVALNGCNPVTISFTIGEPANAVTATAVINANKIATVTASGGNDANYTYYWSDNVTTTSATRDFTGKAAGTYCVTVKDSKSCATANAPCVVVPGPVVDTGNCRLKAEYRQNNLVYIDGNCTCAYRIITSSNPEGVTSLLLARPCQDSLVHLVNCHGERSTVTIAGKNNGCNSGTCPDPNNPTCPVCPDPANPACGGGCNKELDPTCNPCAASDPNCQDLQVTAVVTAPGCNGGGKAVLTVTGGSGSYSTSNPVTSGHGLEITGLPVGETVVTVRDNNTNKIAYKTVTIPATPVSTVNIVNSADPLQSVNNNFTIQISNAVTGPYEISLGALYPYHYSGLTAVNGSLQIGPVSIPSNIGNGPFPVKVTDKNCTEYNYNVYRSICADPALASFSPSVTEALPTYKGKTDGSYTLTNLPAGYTALWSGKGIAGTKTGTTLSGIGAGKYLLVVKNNSTGCLAEFEKVMKDGKTIVSAASLIVTGNCTYTITATYKDADGNVLPGALAPTVSYLWINPVNDEILSASQYYQVDQKPLLGKPLYLKIQVTDGNGNTATSTFEIPASCYPTECHPLDPDCCTGDDCPPSCSDPNDPSCKSLKVTYTAIPAKCGQPSSVQLTVTGGVNNNYRTSNPENDQSGLYITGLSSGTHSITVYDATSQESTVVEVLVPATPVSELAAVNSQNPSLGNNGNFTISIANAVTGPYAINFEQFAPYYVANVSAVNGSLGTYSLPQDKGNGPFFITVTDSYCNKYPLTVYRNLVYCTPTTESLNYVPVISGTSPSYKGQFNGSLSIANPLPAGATAIWTGTGLSQSVEGTAVSGLPAGVYHVVIKKKADDCIIYQDATADIILTDGPDISTSYKLAATGSGCNFTIVASLVDANGNISTAPLPSGLSYKWINPFTGTAIASVQSLDLQSVTLTGNPEFLNIEVSDGSGNTGFGTFVIPEHCMQPDPCTAKLEYSVTDPTCAGGSDGAIRILAADGGYITWTTPSIIQGNAYGWTKAGLKQGEYEIKVYKSTCLNPATFKIGLVDPEPLNITREDFSPRSTRIFVANGKAPYSYKWKDQPAAVTDNTRSQLQRGTEYEVEVTDVKGCKGLLSFTYDPCAISRPHPFAVYTEAENMVTVIPNGGVGEYEFYWDRSGSPELINQYGNTKYGLSNDTYTITVTDANNCTGTTTYTHPGCGSLEVDLKVETENASSSDHCDGTAYITVTGVSNFSDYVILWDREDILELLKKSDGIRAVQEESAIRIFNVCSGAHEVFVKTGGDNPCAVRRKFTVGFNTPPVKNCNLSTLDIEVIGEKNFTKTCATNTVNFDFEVTGGKMPYSYKWEYTAAGSSVADTIPSDKPGFTNAQPGTYQVIVTDALGCSKTENFTVAGATSSLTASEQVTQPVCAHGYGAATVTPSGGAGQEMITWGDDASMHTFTRNDLTGNKTYNYTVTDGAGCSTTGSVTIKDIVAPSAFDSDTMLLCPSKQITLAAPYMSMYNVLWSSPTTGVTIANPEADMITITQPGTYILNRTHRTLFEACPSLEDTIVVVTKTNCTPVSTPCEVYEYELPEPQVDDACDSSKVFAAKADALKRYDDYLEAIKRDFTNQYTSSVMASLRENLVMGFTDNEQHYTLYYYDQAGNLVRTVPPAGVRPLSPAQTDLVQNYWQARNDGDPSNDPSASPDVLTEHTLATTYKYNSLNQLVSQDMPDHTQQDLWEYKNTFTLPNGRTLSTLDANGSKVWAFANSSNQTYLYISTDAGKNFTEGLNLNLGNIMDIQRAGSAGEMYFAVGTGGLLLKAGNGASDWSLLQGPTTTDLLKVHFTDQSNGFIIDNTGDIWKTGSSGAGWTKVTTSAQFLTTALGTLKNDLTGKTIAGIRVRDNKIYITANDNSRGYVYVSTDLTSFSFIRQDFRVSNLNVLAYDGANTDIISVPLVFRKNGNTLVYNRKTNLSGTISQYFSNGLVQVVKTSAGVFKSTDGVTFTAVGNNITTNSTIVNSNGRIAIYEGTNAYRVNNDGTLTSLMAGNTSSVSGYYYNGANDYVALANTTIVDKTNNLTYVLNTSSVQVYYFTSFVVEGNVALVYGNGALTALRLTTSSPGQPLIVKGNSVSTSQKELRHIGTSPYVINFSNQVYAVNINNTGSAPQFTIASTPMHQIAVDYQNSVRSFAFGSSPNNYTYIANDNKVWQVVNGTAATEVKHVPPMLSATALGNDNVIYATAGSGIIYRQNAVDNAMDFIALNNNSENIVAATTASDNKLRVATNANKVYKLDNTNNVYSLVAETVTPALTAPVKSLSNDYLLTTDGKVYMATNTTNTSTGVTTSAWTQQNGVTLANYNVINGTNPTILAGGNNAAISYKSGSSWAQASPFKVQPIADVSVSADGNKLVAVGKQGTILSSTNGGVSFTPLFAPDQVDYTTVTLYGNGFVTGRADGNIYYYSGNTTYSQASVTGATASGGQPVRKIYTSPTGNLWVLRGRELLYSTNGASFSVKLTAASGQDLNDITLYSDGYGYLVGNLGAAYRIVPSGVTEEAETTPLSSLPLAENMVAKLIATDNVITDDKGTGIPPSNLRTVLFTDRLTGYITGTGGIVLKTVDGGYHWHPEGQYSNSSSDSPILAMTSPQHGVYADVNTIGTFRDRALQLASRFWYDELGRLVLSQNAKQYNIEHYLGEKQYQDIAVPDTGKIHAYSYTLYDAIGRITEVGELLTRRQVDTFRYEAQVRYDSIRSRFVPSGVRVQITRTYYDRAAFSGLDSGFVQENLRPRVASVTYQDREGTPYDRATHYSYDIHGNVNTLLQEIRNIELPGASASERIVKRLDYDYDLISGKVNYVYYQRGKADAFTHRYEYDGDNRIREVYTSTDEVVWNKEANYDYYAHGPLARTITGRDTVDQCDYAYTIQGWLKGVQSQNFAYALGYYRTTGGNAVSDYTPIGSVTLQATPMAKSLFNGNISTMSTNTPAFATQGMQATFTQQFTYDQLNRITSSALAGGGNSHRTKYSYDANGNILSLERYRGDGVQFDKLAYKYHNVDQGYLNNSNRLRWVDEDPQISSTVHSEDIEDQIRDNYEYDDIGNLRKDVQEDIDTIEWTLYHKIFAIIRKSGSNKPNMFFSYDINGNRIAKKLVYSDGDISVTYYLRDVSGHPFAIYHKERDGVLNLKEQYIYGASRLGVLKIINESVEEKVYDSIMYGNHEIGLRSYELSDHIGNVHLILSDRKQVEMLGFYPEVKAVYEYYPFGMTLQSIEGGYRFGFNGMEKDFELFEGESYCAEYRDYDSRLGRWTSIDPLVTKFPHFSPYAAFDNNPIFYSDPTGQGGEPTTNEYKTPDGGTIKLPKEVSIKTFDSDKTFIEGVEGVSYKVTQGSVSSFDWNGKTYKAYFHQVTGSFDGYYAEDGTGLSYNNNTLPDFYIDRSGTTQKAMAAFPIAFTISSPNLRKEGAEVVVGGLLTLAALYTITNIADEVGVKAPAIPYSGTIDEGGPPTHKLYTLRARTNGYYPVYTWGSAIPTGTKYLKAGEVWKIGETGINQTRYSQTELNTWNVSMVTEMTGSEKFIKTMEGLRIVEYSLSHNMQLPPGNKMIR